MISNIVRIQRDLRRLNICTMAQGSEPHSSLSVSVRASRSTSASGHIGLSCGLASALRAIEILVLDVHTIILRVSRYSSGASKLSSHARVLLVSTSSGTVSQQYLNLEA